MKPESLKLADGIADAIRQHVQRALAPIGTRLAAVETRCGALSMLAGKGQAADRISELEILIRQVGEMEARIKELEK